MAGLTFKGIKKIYENGYEAVKDFNLEIKDREFIVFVGPSGCGKSTTLRMVAGLEHISGGELYIGDRLVNDVLPKDRDIAMVFQNYALYPHMTVYDNISFGLKLKKMPKEEIDKKVKEVAKILDIEELLNRKPKALSGGQRQRVAMGRAIVRKPKVFLMDEPLSNLDAKLRVQMRMEISKLYKKLDTTFIYVTHDQTEAMTLGTRIVVMKDGVIQQIDTPNEIYEHPVNMFVAGFIGSPQMNFFYGDIKATDKEKFIKTFNSEIKITGEKLDKLKDIHNKEVILGVRPENIIIDKKELESMDIQKFIGKVNLIENLGSELYIHVSKDDRKIIIKSNRYLSYEIGQAIEFGFKLDSICIFDKTTQETIA
ncbi:MAG: sn-glycerol-3-phosphate ABC transporter ATP-binding protein UgpC [Clostridium baratii]|uniref:Maltose ABC transporter n=1 Tax=Clostridium baratii TaxID=1561 RepID=A0A174SV43_9CLOT|nr:sn-glycerol-3-phosphate ABC transporter ATP-binding protein UgpC [Clostridium baratii]MBS6041164.1 sn-glycerol-3-phosphate ABC transporter ATP-binding protein UgpC [Clostridium baratii]CUP99000.1 maltose ABC transporter [Clostridium baratii]